MSRHRRGADPKSVPPRMEGGVIAGPALAVVSGEAPEVVATALPQPVQETQGSPVPLCTRLVSIVDSSRWSCACGAAGKVGRNADGIPYIDGPMLEHRPGERKEG